MGRSSIVLSEEEVDFRFKEGVRLFNTAQYYDSHEEWETIWLQDTSENRHFLQGLILVAASLHHFLKGKEKPAWRCLKSAREKMNTPSKYESKINTAELKNWMNEILAKNEFRNTDLFQLRDLSRQ